jgi:RHS repeat-associated protein
MPLTFGHDAAVNCFETRFHSTDDTIVKTESTGTTNYAWDFENWLASVTFTVSFRYDPFGRRIYKSSSAGTSIYANHGNNLIEETNSSGTAVARDSQGLNIDEPLAMLRSGTISYYQANGLGTLTSLCNTSGALATTYTYESFGNLVTSSATLLNNFRYTGREFDTETSLYYYRARYYDPGSGRFLAEDPIGFGGSTNFYTYVGNSSTGFIDPLGLAECVYSISQHTMTCTENATPPVGPRWELTLGPQGLHSGDPGKCRDNPSCTNNKNTGPIEPGRYKMNPDQRPEHQGWGLYRLQPVKWSKWDSFLYDLSSIGIGNKRGGFEFHIGTRTHGCINAESSDPLAVNQYHAIQRMLEAEDGFNYLTVVP